jgi:hypothetical protein
MATMRGDAGDMDVRRSDRPVRTHTTLDETKGSFLTTEFWAMVGVIVAILVATQQLDQMTGEEGWTLVSAVAIGYMLSRGLAKAGNAHRDTDY